MKTKSVITLFCLFWTTIIQGQVLDTRVSFSFGGWLLGDAIAEIGQSHNIQFVYSPDKIPVGEIVTVSVEDVPLSEGLDELLSDIPVKYQAVGERVVLKFDKYKKLRSLTSINLPVPDEEALVFRSPIDIVPDTVSNGAPILDSITIEPSVKLLMQEKIQRIRQSQSKTFRIPEIDLSFLDSLDSKNGTMRLAQVSILPGVSSNFKNSDRMTNRFSVNGTWGVNGGVNGGELGLLGNTVRGNMQGMQVAGLGNIVKGNMIGSQVSGLFNKTKGTASGVQLAGWSNKAENGNGAQIAGMFNNIRENYTGVQVAGLMNMTRGNNYGWQAAGFLNVANGGRTQMQISGFANAAHDILLGQVGLINIANKVQGVQIGLINVADSVSVVSIGLLNFIKKGYNRLEIARGDVFQWNVAYKFGTNGFYNIIKTSFYSEEGIFTREGRKEENLTWALGYGIGSSARFGRNKKWRTNLEVSLAQINEEVNWAEEPNVHGQAGLTLSRVLFGKLSVFVGGTWNFIYSTKVNPDTGLIGTELPIDPFLDINDRTEGAPDGNIKLWWGWTAGIRF